MKVQAAIQGESVRVSGAKRDDLQAAMAVESTNIIADTDTPSYALSKWPFTSISPSEYNRLSDRQTGMVEGYIRALLMDAESSKRNGTTGH